MFPPMELEGANYYLKAMNCPMHNLIYQSRGRSYRELPLRLFEFGGGLPLREVRRRARPDPGARHDPGRLALLRHPRAGAGRDQAPAELRASGCSATSASTTSTSSCRPATTHARTSSSAPTRSGRPRPQVLERRGRPSPGSSSCPTRAARRSTARRSRSRPGRDRPHLADVDDPVRLQPAGRLRPGVPGRRRLPAAAGDDPLGEVRLDRAVHRRARRALRRRLPAVARRRSRSSGIPIAERHDDYLYDVARAAAGARASGSRSTSPTTGCRRRSATRSCRRCRSW